MERIFSTVEILSKNDITVILTLVRFSAANQNL